MNRVGCLVGVVDKELINSVFVYLVVRWAEGEGLRSEGRPCWGRRTRAAPRSTRSLSLRGRPPRRPLTHLLRHSQCHGLWSVLNFLLGHCLAQPTLGLVCSFSIVSFLFVALEHFPRGVSQTGVANEIVRQSIDLDDLFDVHIKL